MPDYAQTGPYFTDLYFPDYYWPLAPPYVPPPATSGAVSRSCAKVEISPDGINWTDISGETQSVTPGEQTRITTEYYIFTSDLPVIGTGRREPMESMFVIIYTETDAEAYEQARAIFEALNCGDEIYVRYSPAGGNADDEMLTSDEGAIVSFTYPTVGAASTGPIMAGFTVKHPGFTTTIVAS
jgi:hypothetical protein